jgi:hypothetical protein
VYSKETHSSAASRHNVIEHDAKRARSPLCPPDRANFADIEETKQTECKSDPEKAALWAAHKGNPHTAPFIYDDPLRIRYSMIGTPFRYRHHMG